MDNDNGRFFFIPRGIAAVLLFCVFFVSSCTVSGPRDQDSASSYCTLLHMPAVTPAALRPRPFLGVTFGPGEIGGTTSLCREGSRYIEIASVISGTPADFSGLRKGDFILSVNGKPLCLGKGDVGDSFRDMIDRQSIGASVTLGVLRGERKITLRATLTQMPLHEQAEAPPVSAGCSGSSQSVLVRALRQEDDLSRFRGILAGLRDSSNRVHNSAWFSHGPYNPFQLREFTYLIRHPMEDGVAARALTDRLTTAVRGRDLRIDSLVLEATRMLDIGLTAPAKEEITFPGLLKAMETVRKRLGRCFDKLTPEERKLLREKALNPWDDSRWNDIVKASVKIDFRDLLDSFTPLLPFFSREGLSALRRDVAVRFGSKGTPVLYEGHTPLGKVIVGGPGPNVYREDAALILDLGGDDVYLNNAGGTRPGIPVAMVIDWGGNDLYLTKESFSQGAGLLGGGFLLDLSGNDVFESLDGSQGAGFFGMGLLYHGDGNALFKARTYAQGVGEMGAGIIWNGSGDTRYLCSENGQALGLFRGLGMLMDDKGNDYYQLGGLDPDFRDPAKSTVSMGQGFGRGIRPEGENQGVSGGIGILIDAEGNDVYDADYFAQGASYYYGTGILEDLSGNDRYIAGRYTQGAGIHSSVGILADRRGDDFYYSSFGVSQGMGHDYGVGYLGDDRGNDRYIGGLLSQGAATRGGAGILADGKGNDRFICGSECQAFARDAKCIGILADGQPGRDTMSRYSHPARIRLGLKKKPSAVSSQQ